MTCLRRSRSVTVLLGAAGLATLPVPDARNALSFTFVLCIYARSIYDSIRTGDEQLTVDFRLSISAPLSLALRDFGGMRACSGFFGAMFQSVRFSAQE